MYHLFHVLITFNKQLKIISMTPAHQGLISMKFFISFLHSEHFAPLKGIAFHVYVLWSRHQTGWRPKFYFWSYYLVPWGTSGCQSLIRASAQDARLQQLTFVLLLVTLMRIHRLCWLHSLNNFQWRDLLPLTELIKYPHQLGRGILSKKDHCRLE